MTDRNGRPPNFKPNTTGNDNPTPTADATSGDNLAAALRLAGLGWSIIPLCHPEHQGFHYAAHRKACNRPGKLPTVRWKQHQTVRLTAEELAAIWARNPLLNVGVVCGPVSGIVMVDIDTDQGEEAWQELSQGGMSPTWEFGTGRGGRHLVFGWTRPEAPAGNPFRGLAGHLDFLGDGRQSVAPPSLHHTGVCYRWTVGGPGSDMPLAEAPPALVARVLEGGRPSRRPGVCVPSAPRATPAGDRQFSRARAYLAKCQPAVSGQGGHDQTFKVADKLVNGFGLAVDAALSLLMEDWNGRCDPPWSEKDLLHKLQDANERGVCTPIIQRESPASSSESARGCDNDHYPCVPSGPVRSASLPRTSARATRNRSVSWLWAGRIPAGSLTILDGKKGMGKSTLLAAVAADVTGGPRLPGGDQQTRTLGRALWLAYEEDVTVTTRRRLEAAEANLDLVEFLGLDAAGRMVKRVELPAHFQHLEDTIREAGAALLVVDPWNSILAPGLSENSNQDVRSVLEPLQRLAAATGCAVVMTRHLKKGGNGPAIDQGLGSTAIGNVARTVLRVDRDPADREGRILAPVACNLGREPASLAFRVVGPEGAGRIAWGGEVAIDADQLAGEGEDAGKRNARVEARLLLRARIGDGWVASSEVLAEAEKAGISRDTLARARADLGIQYRRMGGVGDKGWSEWGPPEGGWPAE